MKLKLESHVKPAEAHMLNDNDNYGHLPEYEPYTLYTNQYEPLLQLEFDEGSSKPKEVGEDSIAD